MQHQHNLKLKRDFDPEISDMGSKANPIDTAVGQRIRNRRLELGLSQTNLGDKVGVSFQQIQKYEKGTNRVSASALYEIARVLRVPLTFFFDMILEAALEHDSTVDAATRARLAYIRSREGERLVDLFQRLPSAARKHLLGMMSALAAAPRERPTENAEDEGGCGSVSCEKASNDGDNSAAPSATAHKHANSIR